MLVSMAYIWCIDRMCKMNSPSANPVARFPARATGAATATAKAKASYSSHVVTFISTARRFILGGTTLEAVWAASKVVGPTGCSGAVPVTGPDVRPSTEPKRRARATTSPSKTSIVTSLTWSWLSTPLAWIPPLKVEMVAWPAIPISWPVHFSFSKFHAESTSLAHYITNKQKMLAKYYKWELSFHNLN